jgi:hypothetical protein
LPQSQEKTSEPETELPNPELNPLLNPTLGRHLGRWAQVYFTSPPEKREAAVGELLRELQGTSAASSEQFAPDQPPDTRTRIEQPEAVRIVEAPIAEASALRCAECGHPYSNPQRFCGMCGAVLDSATPRHLEVASAADTAAAEPKFTHADLPGFSPARESPGALTDSFSDIRWLREKGLAGENNPSWKRVVSRLAPAVIAILAIGILFYAQSRPQSESGPQSDGAAKAAPATAGDTSAQSPARSSGPSPTASDEAKTLREKTNTTVAGANVPLPTASTKETAPAAQTPSQASTQQAAAEPVSVPPPAGKTGSRTSVLAASAQASAPNPMNGAAELAQAEDFLNGKTHPRNSEVAAQYLWRAVGKENPSAILLLSDMYLAGDGVPKSCDQARLLLSAAARKGVPQAADKLSDLLRSGCPK